MKTKTKLTKKILCMFLCITIMLSLVPMTVLAATGPFSSLQVSGTNVTGNASGTNWSYDASSQTLTISGNIGNSNSSWAVNAATEANSDAVLNIQVTKNATLKGGISAGGKLNLVIDPGVTLKVEAGGMSEAIYAGYSGGVDDSVKITGGGTVYAVSNGYGIYGKSGIWIEGVTVAVKGTVYGLHSGSAGSVVIQNNSRVYAEANSKGSNHAAILVNGGNYAKLKIRGQNTVVIAGYALGSESNGFVPNINVAPVAARGIYCAAIDINCGHIVFGGTVMSSNASSYGDMQFINATEQRYQLVGKSHINRYISNGNGTSHTHTCAEGCPIPISGTVENCSGGTATCTSKAACTKCGQHYGSVHSGVDTNNDHLCDLCNETWSYCEDSNNNSSCDICGKILSGVNYVEYSWNGTKLIQKSQWVEEGQSISSNSKQLSSGWYVVNTDVTISERIEISGTVNLILTDGVTLTTPKGIDVPDGSTLNIYGQSKGTGKLVAQTNNSSGSAIGGTNWGSYGNINIYGGDITAINDQYGSGIGSGKNANTGGTVTIYSGIVTATGSDSSAGIGSGQVGTPVDVTIYGGTINSTGGTFAAGIGGGSSVDGGNITIYGGDITAKGVNAAGIGGGYMGSGGNMTINGGNITATGGSSSACIGGGNSASGGTITINGGSITTVGTQNYTSGIGGGSYASCGTIIINGGSINAGGNIGAAIGSNGNLAAYSGENEQDSIGTITINGGTVIASGSNGGAGIGSGQCGLSVTVTINGGNVTAAGGTYSAGIGGGREASSGDVVITGGTITAKGYQYGAGIGGGYKGSGGNIVITGGNVYAKAGSRAETIGKGYSGNSFGTLTDGNENDVSLHIATFDGITSATVITAIKDIDGNNIEYGLNDVYTTDDGKLYIYLPASSVPFEIVVGGTTYYNHGEGVYKTTVPHFHAWEYSLDDTDTITATCTADGCELENGNGGSIQIIAPTNLSYDGKEKSATLKGSIVGVETPEIVYEGDRTNAGTVKASITMGNVTASITFDITTRYKGEYYLEIEDQSSNDYDIEMFDNYGRKVKFKLVESYTSSEVTKGSKAEIEDKSTTTYAAYDLMEENAQYPGSVEPVANDGSTIVYQIYRLKPKYTVEYYLEVPEDTEGAIFEGGKYYLLHETFTKQAEEDMFVSFISKNVSGVKIAGVFEDKSDNIIEDTFKSFEKHIFDHNTTVNNGHYSVLVERNGENLIRLFYNIDITPPTGEITIKNNIWKSFLNTITFGIFSKEKLDVTVTADDNYSGVAKVEYLLSETALDENNLPTDGWTEVAGNRVRYTFSIQSHNKGSVYVRITDNCNNVAVINSDGIVVYEDSNAVTEQIETIFNAGVDKDVTVKLNGNTIKEIKGSNGKTLTVNKDYTTSQDGDKLTITLKGTYLDTLNADTYTFTVSYNPLGETYVEAVDNESPATTTFTLIVNKTEEAITNISDISKEYDGTAVTAPTFDKLGNGLVTIEYKVKGAEYSTYTTTAPINVGDYVVRVTVAESDNYKEASATAEFSIDKAPLTDVSVEQNGKLTYDGGKALTPTVIEKATAVNNQIVSFTYSATENGTYGTLPSFTTVGEYTVYYKASAPNHEDAMDSFIVTVDKATLTEPTIAGKPYNGSAQTADISETDLYTVEQNNGGTTKGSYDVVLKLKDAKNYKWAITDNTEVTLQFMISAAENTWTISPDISDWTYGETANTPTYEAKYGTVKVFYSGTANDGTDYNSETAPTKAGNYTATFTIDGTENYSVLIKKVSFTIAKASYDMTSVKWDYTDAYQYDGLEKSVSVIRLAEGVTVTGYTGNKATAVGNYTAKVTLAYDANNYNTPVVADLNWKIENNWTPTEYTISNANGDGWHNTDVVITAQDGYKVSPTNTADGVWSENLSYSEETADGNVTFYLKNIETGAISLAKTVSYKLDKVAPTGKVYFDERNGWESFLNTISFGLFYKDEVTVKVDSADDLSGVASVEYYASNRAITLDEVKEITKWTAYNGDVGVTLEDAKQFVYFVRITDNAGNVAYLSTEGAEYDITAPVISGVENATTYYTTQNITVSDKNLDTVTLNDEPATESITLEGNKDTSYTIVATDKAGNTTTVTVMMKPISELSAPIDSLTKDNVNSSNEQTIDDVMASVVLVDTTNATDDEKATLKEIIDKVSELEKVIDDTKAEIARVTEELNKYDNATVNSEDATVLEQLSKDIKALIDSGNLTEAEISTLTEALGKVEEMEETVANTTTENNRISDAVDGYDLATVTSDDKADLEQLLNDIEKQLESTNLTEQEISELNGDKKAVEDLLTKISGNDKLIDKLIEDIENYSEDSVKLTDKEAIEQIIEDIDALLKTENLTEDEKKALENVKSKAEDLLDIIETDELVYGDVNCDREINMLDVISLQKVIAKLNKLSDYGKLSEVQADVTHDGFVNLDDVVAVQKYIARLITTLDP